MSPEMTVLMWAAGIYCGAILLCLAAMVTMQWKQNARGAAQEVLLTAIQEDVKQIADRQARAETRADEVSKRMTSAEIHVAELQQVLEN